MYTDTLYCLSTLLASQDAIAWSYALLVPIVSKHSIAESTLYRREIMDTFGGHLRPRGFAPQQPALRNR